MHLLLQDTQVLPHIGRKYRKVSRKIHIDDFIAYKSQAVEYNQGIVTYFITKNHTIRKLISFYVYILIKNTFGKIKHHRLLLQQHIFKKVLFAKYMLPAKFALTFYIFMNDIFPISYCIHV